MPKHKAAHVSKKSSKGGSGYGPGGGDYPSGGGDYPGGGGDYPGGGGDYPGPGGGGGQGQGCMALKTKKKCLKVRGPPRMRGIRGQQTYLTAGHKRQMVSGSSVRALACLLDCTLSTPLRRSLPPSGAQMGTEAQGLTLRGSEALVVRRG